MDTELWAIVLIGGAIVAYLHDINWKLARLVDAADRERRRRENAP
jgi:hypothetical protein